MAKRKTEFSKVIFFINTCLTAVVVFFTLIAVIVERDTQPLGYLIPAVFAEQATSTGFYFWKARKENEIKLMKAYPDIAQKALFEHEEDFLS